MSDIFREIDEDLRREQAKKLWDRFAPYVLVGAVLIVVATAGYRGWVYWQDTRAAETGDRFLEALQQSNSGQPDLALGSLQEVIDSGHGGYPILARFRLATERANQGDINGAVGDFDLIAASNATEELRNLARLRAALLLADSATLPDMQQRIGNLAGTGNTWRHTAREVLGLVAWRTGDYVAARGYFQDIADDQEAPSDVRRRAEMMLALIAMRLDAAGNIVTPPPAPTAPAPTPAPPPPPVDAAPTPAPAPPAPAATTEPTPPAPGAADTAPQP